MTGTEQEKQSYGREEKAYMHWLYQASNMGGRRFFKALEQIGTPFTIYEMVLRGKLSGKLDKLSEKLDKLSGKLDSSYHDRLEHMEEFTRGYDVLGEYDRMLERGIGFVVDGEKEYPAKMASISGRPVVLYYIGKLPDDGFKSVAMVGARECSEYGKSMARLFGERLAEADVQVISGMARGIDGISQRAALDAGGYSLGVLGCGIDICYPVENRRLYEALAKQGCLCSEYPPGTNPNAGYFPRRNRIISALSDAVLVVEAREKSGSLITVDLALEQGREVYAVPGRINDCLSSGCNHLIRQGAGLVNSPDELLQEISEEYAKKPSPGTTQRPAPEGRSGNIFRTLDYQPQSVQNVQEEYERQFSEHLTIPELLYELMQLCVGGYAKQISSGYYIKL
jgi:DNA processing protein